jgi:dihydrofolate reductase
MSPVRPAIELVVAAAANDVIGMAGTMPWHLPADLARFKRLTVGKPVVMGRRTLQSIGRPLSGRHNIVLSRDPEFAAEGVTVVPNLAEAIAAAGLLPAARAGTIMVIGGGEIYALARPIATAIELTRIEAWPEGDTFFPAPEPACWHEVWREDHVAEGGRPGFSFIRYERPPLAGTPPPR